VLIVAFHSLADIAQAIGRNHEGEFAWFHVVLSFQRVGDSAGECPEEFPKNPSRLMTSRLQESLRPFSA